MSETILNDSTRPQTPRRMFEKRTQGFLMVVVGASLWGLSGAAAQELFQTDGFTPGWLVTIRMVVSGLILLSGVFLTSGKSTLFAIWRSAASATQLVIFSLLGLLAVQYTYFAAIHFGNAATATFLQYLGPALIVVWVAMRLRQWPTRRQSAALAFATLGTFLLVTNGSVHQVVVPPKAIFWGLVSALAMAFYTLYPGALMRKFGSAVTTGWAMLVGGVAFLPFAQPWQVSNQHWTLTSALLVVFVILFGTLLAFYLYLSSMHYIAPAETSLLASVEPLSAAVAAVLWLHVQLGYATILGGLSIIMTVVLLAFPAIKRPIQRPQTTRSSRSRDQT